MHDNEHHKPNLDALVSNAAQRRLQPSLTLEEIVSAPLTIAEHITSPAKPPQSSRARKNLIKTRLSDSEYRAFTARVKRSKLSASEFLRRAALTGRIVIPLHTELDVAMLDELALLKADVGRIGGLLKMTIRPNEGQRTLRPAEWEELLHAARQVERMAKRLAALEVKITDGYRQA
jgi:putative transfer protein